MLYVVSLVLLGLLLSILHWLDAFHLVCASLSILIFFFIIHSRKRIIKERALAAERERELFVKNIPDIKEDERHSSAGRNIVLGILQGGLLLLITLILVSGLKLTPVYGLFYDRDYKSIIAKIEVYQEIGANEQIFKLVSEKVERTVSSKKQKELATIAYNALVAWGDSLKNNEERSGKFEEARDFAKTWGLDSQLAEAKLESENLSEKLQGPSDLPENAHGAITQIDTSNFPPSIIAYVCVEDGSGEPIEWLKPKDFVILHNDMQITKFELAPISEFDQSNIALIIDVSGSMKGKPLKDSQAGAEEFILALGVIDQIEIIAFNEKPLRKWGWERDGTMLANAIKKLEAGGNTAIYDAVSLALDDFPRDRQKAIVLFTDGADTSSKENLEPVLQKARERKIPIYVIGLASKDLSPQILQRIADETGGVYLEAANSSELQDLYRKIAGKIKKQYRLVLNPEIQSEKTAQSLTVTVGRKNYLKLARQYDLER